MSTGIEVTARDIETGDVDSIIIEPGNFVCVCAEPMYVSHEARHANDTVTLTLRRRRAGDGDQ